MIRSFKDKETEEVWFSQRSRKFQSVAQRAHARLSALNAARELKDLSIPSYRLEKLAGDREGQYSVRINDQYRICFRWRDKHAYEVEIVDYH